MSNLDSCNTSFSGLLKEEFIAIQEKSYPFESMKQKASEIALAWINNQTCCRFFGEDLSQTLMQVVANKILFDLPTVNRAYDLALCNLNLPSQHLNHKLKKTVQLLNTDYKPIPLDYMGRFSFKATTSTNPKTGSLCFQIPRAFIQNLFVQFKGQISKYLTEKGVQSLHIPQSFQIPIATKEELKQKAVGLPNENYEIQFRSPHLMLSRENPRYSIAACLFVEQSLFNKIRNKYFNLSPIQIQSLTFAIVKNTPASGFPFSVALESFPELKEILSNKTKDVLQSC